jgi:hypothetical protein
MKHISQFTHNIERLEAFADVNGHIPETLADLCAPYFKNFTGFRPHCEDDYDDIMTFLGCVAGEIALADGSAAALVQSLASSSWKHIED